LVAALGVISVGAVVLVAMPGRSRVREERLAVSPVLTATPS
jgi:hypothetical protein